MMPVRFPRHHGQKSYFIQVNIIRHGLSWALLVCIPGGRPLCEKCPLESLCLAHRRGEEEQYPVKPPKKPRRIEKKRSAVEWEDTVAIRKRSSKGLLASLYEYVNLDGKKSAAEAAKELGIAEADIRETEDLPDAVHIFSPC